MNHKIDTKTTRNLTPERDRELQQFFLDRAQQVLGLSDVMDIQALQEQMRSMPDQVGAIKKLIKAISEEEMDDIKGPDQASYWVYQVLALLSYFSRAERETSLDDLEVWGIYCLRIMQVGIFTHIIDSLGKVRDEFKQLLTIEEA